MDEGIFKFEKGEVLRDRLTGYEGVVVARTDYITGCARYSLQPRILAKDTGRPQDWTTFDEGMLERVPNSERFNPKEETSKKPVPPGGPKDVCAKPKICNR